MFVRLSDGKRVPLDYTPLSMFKGDDQIISIGLDIYARATAAPGYDPWNYVEMDFTDTNLYAKFRDSVSGDIIWQSENTQLTNCVFEADGNWFGIMSLEINLDEVSDSSWVNGDAFSFVLSGVIEYRGLGTNEQGDWNTIDIPSIGSVVLQYINSDIFISWRDPVEYTAIVSVQDVSVPSSSNTFTVDVYVSDVENLGSGTFKIQYDTTKINFVEINPTPCDWTVYYNNIGNSLGWIGTTSSLSGTVHIGSFIFEKVPGVSGTTTITITKVEMLDSLPEGNNIYYSSLDNGVITFQ
jgi:hypothetical protein